jgi:hypothetical protein
MRGILGAVAVLALTGFGFSGVKGDGNIQEQTRKVTDFKAVGVSNGIHARVRIGSPASAKLKGDANLLALLELEVKDGSLRTVFKTHDGVRPTQPIELELVAPSLEAVAASGGAEILATAGEARRFELSSSGGAVLKVSGVRADHVSIAASGGSEVTVTGQTTELAISSSGGAKLHARELIASDATVNGSGGAEVELHAKERVNGSLSGGAEITVEGSPAKRSIVTSGGAEAHFKS